MGFEEGVLVVELPPDKVRGVHALGLGYGPVAAFRCDGIVLEWPVVPGCISFFPVDVLGIVGTIGKRSQTVEGESLGYVYGEVSSDIGGG